MTTICQAWEVLHGDAKLTTRHIVENGDMDISKVDFKKIEQQMNNIQKDMLKLAAMMIPTSGSDKQSES